MAIKITSATNSVRQSPIFRIPAPSSGATNGATSDIACVTARADRSASPSKQSFTSASEMAATPPPVRPCSERNSSTTPIEGAAAQPIQNSIDAAAHATATDFRPNLSLIGPNKSMPTAMNRKNSVTLSVATDCSVASASVMPGNAGMKRSLEMGKTIDCSTMSAMSPPLPRCFCRFMPSVITPIGGCP